VVVVGHVYVELKDKFVAAAKAMKLGYGLDESVRLGPYTAASGRDGVNARIDRALSDGAMMVLDGPRAKSRMGSMRLFLDEKAVTARWVQRHPRMRALDNRRFIEYGTGHTGRSLTGVGPRGETLSCALRRR
jgi:hypothetical protein